MPDNDCAYSVVVPVYNSSTSLVELAGRLDRVFREVVRESYEVVMVDDGSSNPDTWRTMEALAAGNQAVRCIQLSRNFGKAGAVLCGFSEARGRYVITMDDDLQHRPEDIPLLLSMKEHDVVIGSFADKRHGPVVRATSRIKGWFDRIIMGRPRGLKNSPYKLFKSEVIKAMLGIRTPYPFIPALMFYVTKDVVCVDVVHDARGHGKTGYTFTRRFRQFLRLLINNSALLLQSVAAIGFGMALVSVVYSIYLVYKRLHYSITVPGWTSLMVVVLITSGLVLFSLGVVGEYLIRIINGIEGRPPYVVRRRTEKGTTGDNTT